MNEARCIVESLKRETKLPKLLIVESADLTI